MTRYPRPKGALQLLYGFAAFAFLSAFDITTWAIRSRYYINLFRIWMKLIRANFQSSLPYVIAVNCSENWRWPYPDLWPPYTAPGPSSVPVAPGYFQRIKSCGDHGSFQRLQGGWQAFAGLALISIPAHEMVHIQVNYFHCGYKIYNLIHHIWHCGLKVHCISKALQ